MAVVKPFRAVRYDERKAGPLESLVAPPFDVISPEQRAELAARNPHNVVHLTLPDDEAHVARLWREWAAEGVLTRDDEPGTWVLSQDYVGPDGVARTRVGVAASLRVEPYERRVVLPHERTHPGPKAGRLRLLRALRAHVEPIFVLHEGPPPEVPRREPDVVVDGVRAWRAGEEELAGFEERQLLIADGHHRYETALAFHEEDGSEESAYLLAVLVSTRQDGVTIFPTHRLFKSTPPGWNGRERASGDLESALAEARRAGGWVAYDRGGAALVRHGERFDVQAVDSLGHEGISYTPYMEEATRAVDEGAAAAAAFVRPPRIEDVWEVARRGETLPQKTTFFYPKLLSGLLFHPLEP